MGRTETLGKGHSPSGADRITKAQASGELCPDVIELAAELGYDRPSKILWLQTVYDQAMASQISREEFTAVLTKIVGRKGSVPVDVMGDRQARSIDRERAA
jgi:hypothetical protein